ncbi:MAG: hypothetical protein WAN86_19415, partial [Hyphomicrobiaceae bacterium]
IASAPIAAEAPASLPPPASVPPLSAPPPGPPPVPAVPVLPPPAEEADAVVGDVPTVPGGPAPRPRPRKPVEPKIFVPPRAPDDPGTDASDLDDLQGYPTKA